MQTFLLLSLAVQVTGLSTTFGPKKAFVVGWDGHPVLTCTISRAPAKPEQRFEPAQAVYLGYPHGPKTSEFIPSGRTRATYSFSLPQATIHVSASSDSFQCSDDPSAVLGSSIGNAEVTGANSIYDRSGDWLITFQARQPRIRASVGGGYTVETLSEGTITFRPHYYRDHLGYFLWDRTKPLWTQPISGWCSWAAHGQDVKESDVLDAGRFFSQNLKEYGYDIVQIDDGYQRVLQFGQDPAGAEPFSNYWTKPNGKFPRGMSSVAQDLKALGLTPGIWIGYYLPLGLKHQEGYVTDPDGQPHKGPWVNYAVNGLDKAAVDEAYIDSIREFKKQGWDYFKVDTLRHILYDNYRKVPDYWSTRGESMETAYRAILQATKSAAGKSYVLACWGTLPELAGLVDGARIGEDVGPDFDSMRRSAKYIAQFQYLNNVVWRDDPDYMCLRLPVEQAKTWATMTSMAGGHLMVSDPVSSYDPARVDILRRVAPSIFSRPNTVASHAPDPEYLSFDAEKGGEQWKVLARFAWTDLPAAGPSFAAGSGQKWLAFDFWDERFLGEVDRPLFHPMAKGQCQVISLRPALGRPQVLGTNRHISQGAYELENVKWNGHRLSGSYRRDRGRAWSLYLYVPAGWKATDSSATVRLDGEVLKLTFPEGSGWTKWSVNFIRSAN